MSKFNFSKGKLSKFISSKGFYAAIGICLAGAGIATWLAVDRTITGIESQNQQIIQKEQQFNEFPPLEETAKKQPDIPKESVKPSPRIEKPSEPSSSSATQSSSPALAPEPEEPSKPVSAQPKSPTLSYVLPVKGSIVKPFSNNELVKNETLREWSTHDGVDILAQKDTDVIACAEGVVAEIRFEPMWETVVTINHVDGRQSIYCGLNGVIPIKVGETVMAKQVIGRVKGVPCEGETQTHIHFAMKKDGAWVDPLSVMAKA